MTYFSQAWPVPSSPRGAGPAEPAWLLGAEEGGGGSSCSHGCAGAAGLRGDCAEPGGAARSLRGRRRTQPAQAGIRLRQALHYSSLRATEPPLTKQQDNPPPLFPCICAVRSFLPQGFLTELQLLQYQQGLVAHFFHQSLASCFITSFSLSQTVGRGKQRSTPRPLPHTSLYAISPKTQTMCQPTANLRASNPASELAEILFSI